MPALAADRAETSDTAVLILTRRLGESLCIADDITVSVLDVNKGKVRLGIKAPKEVPVHREEIYERIKKEQIRSTDAA